MTATIAPAGVNSLRNGPNQRGRFGDYGGRFVAETLMPLVLEVERAYAAVRKIGFEKAHYRKDIAARALKKT